MPAGWNDSESVHEICSVSDCVAQGPSGWIEYWLHNDLGFFNTQSDAYKIMPSGNNLFQIFAYRLLLLEFSDGHSGPLKSLNLPVDPLPENFTSLGFDIVNRTVSDSFECSPLSCNGLAAEIPVNQYCLVDSLDVAIDLAMRFSLEKPEPGPYFVLEVFRVQH